MIFRDTDAYFATLTGAQLGGEGRLLLPFWNSKKVSWFVEERPWLCPSLGWIFHLKFNFKSILDKKLQNVSLQILFVSCFWQNLYRSAVVPQTFHSLPWKVPGCAPVPRHYSFCKTLNLQCMAVFWMRLCLGNCSVICTVTLFYVLLIDTFRIMGYSGLWFFRYMQAYSITFSVIEAYSHTSRH